jgi:hypothetical protein
LFVSTGDVEICSEIRKRGFVSSSSSFTATRAEWTPFHTYCYSENVVVPGIELGTSALSAKNSDY